jgi:HEAT repeat protein
MPSDDVDATLRLLFDSERAVRRAHDELVDSDPEVVLPVLERATRDALELDKFDEDETSLRLVRIAEVLGEMQGPRVVDLLIDILGSDEPEARHSAGEALSGLAFDRFKEVAVGVERAIDRLTDGSLALAELAYLLAEVSEPGVAKLLGRLLTHRDPDVVAAAIEALVERGDSSAVRLIEPLLGDPRHVQLEDEGGAEGEVTIGELAAEARALLEKSGHGEGGIGPTQVPE